MRARQFQVQHDRIKPKRRKSTDAEKPDKAEVATDASWLKGDQLHGTLPPAPDAVNRSMTRTLRQNAILQMQQTHGNRHVARMIATSRQPAQSRIQRKRIPGKDELAADVPTDKAEQGPTHAALIRLIMEAWDSLLPDPATRAARKKPINSPDEMNRFPDFHASARQQVVEAMPQFFSQDQDMLPDKLEEATREQLLGLADLIRRAEPGLTLGDPLQTEVKPREGTDDSQNLDTLVNLANLIFNMVESGFKDAELAQVFGEKNVEAAKAKYVNAHWKMLVLKLKNGIAADRSGFNKEAGIGGETPFGGPITLEGRFIDDPWAPLSIVTLIHESMHAGNADVKDYVYEGGGFLTVPDAVKLTNAKHFEIIPRQILKIGDGPFAVAPGAGAPQSSTPSQPQPILDEATATLKDAWTAAANLHDMYLQLYRMPDAWDSAKLSDILPYWSKVEMLTMHTRAATIDPAGPPAAKPVTQIDIALSEGLVSALNSAQTGLLILGSLWLKDLESKTKTPDLNTLRDHLISKALADAKVRITGSESLDLLSVKRLAQAWQSQDRSDILQVRRPDQFPEFNAP